MTSLEKVKEALKSAKERIVDDPSELMNWTDESLKIEYAGNFYLIRPGMRKGKIWIENQDGEGGDFSEIKLFGLLRRFFDENF